MITNGLFHIAVKTNDLEATKDFYSKVLGLIEIFRPDFGFPGAWLAAPIPGGQAILHCYAGGPALGADGTTPLGTAAIDHISFSCSGYQEYRNRFIEMDLPFREFLVPNTSIWQLFIYDPSGVQLELTFEGKIEKGPLPDMSDGRRYVAGASFFDPTVFLK
jgi:catechol 2,3-dioxygenase-like lactoylglutathione lyase family enzyme